MRFSGFSISKVSDSSGVININSNKICINKSMKRYKLILLLLVIPILSSAKIYFPQFTNYNIDRGLSQCYVPSIENDKYGFVWFGTFDGLNRFDGINFKVFRHDPNDVNS